MAALSCVELTNVVVSAFAPKFTTEFDTKFVPLTTSVNAAPPGACVLPELVTLEIVG